MVRFVELSTLETDECVLWDGPTDGAGYGLVTAGGFRGRAHRMALLRRGEVPFSGAMACHRPAQGCQPACMNYRHLRWGTPADNAADRALDDTNNTGGRCRTHKLTPEIVREIRSLAGSMTQGRIAAKFGISREYVGQLIRRQSWAWLPI